MKIKWRHELSPVSIRENFKVFLYIGLFDAFNGILVVYAAPSSRTPPILQALFTNVSILYAMLATKLLVNRSISYLHLKPLLALVFVILAIIISLLPDIIEIANGKASFAEGKTPLAWSILFLIGVGPGAIYNVFQEKFLKSRNDIEDRNKTYDMTVMLFWGCFLQLLTMLVFFWVDILPWYGFSDSITGFGTNLGGSIKCFFGGNNCTTTWFYGLLFNVGYTMTYAASAGLNEDSANFNMICSMLVSPISVFYWIIFPKQGVDVPPWWSFTFALLLFLPSTYLWKTWEVRKQPTKSVNQ